jgi:hypothetical protein
MRKFKRGQFESFRALNQIHLGKYELDIKKNHSFEYDGSTIRYAGYEYGVPQLRGLYGAWYVEEADQQTRYVSQPADIQVSHATPEAREAGMKFTMEEASEEEAVVGTVTEQKEIREAARDGRRDRLAELRAQREARGKRGVTASMKGRAGGVGEVVTDTNPHAPPPENALDVDPDVEAVLMSDGAEWADSDTMSALPTEPAVPQHQYRQAVPAHARGIQGVPASESEAVARANEMNRRAILEAVDRHEAYDAPKSREQMGGARHNSASDGKARVGSGGKFGLVRDDSGGEVVKSYNFSGGAAVGEAARNEVQATDVTRAGSRQPVQVGRAVAAPVQNRQAGALVTPDPTETVTPQAQYKSARSTQVPVDGNTAITQNLPGGGTGDVDVSVTGDDLRELIPGAAVAGEVVPPRRAPAPPPALSEDDEIAEIVAGWSTKRNWQKRVQEAVDYYGDWPEALDAICAKESDKVAAQIRKRVEG